MRRHGVSIAGAGGRLLVGVAVAILVVGACGASQTAPPGPDRVKAAGTLTSCIDLAYPPSGSYAVDGTTPEGFDVDVAAEIARRLGVSSAILNVEFDYLIRDLRAKKCDLLIGAMTSTFGDRAQQVDFVDYLRPWTGFFVAAGNPKGIRTVEDLAGRSVAVAPGFVNEASLRAASADLAAAGKSAIKIVTTSKSDEAWVADLTEGQVDALAGDSIDVVYQADKPPYAGTSELGGPLLDPQPIGIGIRKDDAGMKAAVAAAIDAMYAEGTMKAIVEKWGLTNAVELLK